MNLLLFFVIHGEIFCKQEFEINYHHFTQKAKRRLNIFIIND